jgi:hypothetical protein
MEPIRLTLGYDYAESMREVDRYSRIDRYQILVNFLSKDIKITTKTESTKDERYYHIPKSGWDYFKSLLPSNLQFGWLKPEYGAQAIAIKHEHSTINHYHVYPLPLDVNRVSWMEPSYGEWCRIAVYGNTPDKLAESIYNVIEIFKSNNLPPRRLVVTQRDYIKLKQKLFSTPYFISGTSTIEEYYGLKVDVSQNTIVSFIEL